MHLFLLLALHKDTIGNPSDKEYLWKIRFFFYFNQSLQFLTRYFPVNPKILRKYSSMSSTSEERKKREVMNTKYLENRFNFLYAKTVFIGRPTLTKKTRQLQNTTIIQMHFLDVVVSE